MSNTQKKKYKHTYRLWRVNIDGKIVEGRWKNALGAINGAADKLFGKADKLFGNTGLQEPRQDFTDMVIHVECIGEAEPHPKPLTTEPRIPEPSTPKRPKLSPIQQWYRAMGGIVDWQEPT